MTRQAGIAIPAVALAMLSAACTGSIDGGETAPEVPRAGPAAIPGPGPGSGAQGSGPAAAPGTAPIPGGASGSAAAPSAASVDSATLFACKTGERSSSAPRLWRLTPLQYTNTVKVLLGGATPPGFKAPVQLSPQKDKFPNYAAPNGVDDLSVEQSFEVASTLAAQLVPRLKKDHPCVAAPDAACFSAVASKLGAQAFRRPLTAEETSRYGGLMATRHAALGTDLALTMGVEALLSSPHFLFRAELGDGRPDASGRMRLTGHEMASVVSFALTDAPPDAPLLAAAQAGMLATPEGIRAQVERLAADPGKLESFARFFQQYLRYDETATVFKDPKLFPQHKPAALVADTDAFVRDMLSGRKDLLGRLLTSRTAFVRAASAGSYGLTGVTSTTAQKVELPADQRAGLLTHPSFLSAFSQADGNDPIARGKFIRTELLCGVVPDIPLNVVQEVPDDPRMTLRERLAAHVKEESCRGCHSLMDPLGFAFEAYDHVGRWRTTEVGKPVDTGGTLIASGNQDGSFKGPIELVGKLATSTVVEQCLVRHALRYLAGRDETPTDGCALASAHQAFRAAGGDAVELFAALLASDSFLFRHSAK